MINAGIFGPKLSGKTTLAKEISKSKWRLNGLKSIVLDPNLEIWGPQAFVTNDPEKFDAMIWKERNCIVFMEEAAVTINRDRDRMSIFTRLRHQEHMLVISGHSGGDLLPGMRQQFDTLFLFRQPGSAAKVWAEVFSDKRIFTCMNLNQYEFLHCELFKEPRVLKLKI